MAKLMHNDEQIEKNQNLENDEDHACDLKDHFVEIVTSESWLIWGALRIRFHPLTLQRSSSLPRAPIGQPAISHPDRDAQRTRARSSPAQPFARFGGNSFVFREKLRPISLAAFKTAGNVPPVSPARRARPSAGKSSYRGRANFSSAS